MKLVVLILLFICQYLAFDLPRDGCKSDLTIDDKKYNVTNTYHIGDAYPADTHYDKYGNLFYVESGRNADGFYFNVKMIRPDNGTAESIPGLPVGRSYSIAADKKRMDIYFGTAKGIFLYNYKTQGAKLISSPHLKLNMLFIDHDGNKYITESLNGIEELYLLDGDKKIRFKSLEALNEMAIDNKNDFYFIKGEQLFVLKSTLSTPALIGNITYNGFAQISFYKERIFIASENLAYAHENDTNTLKKVENIPGKVTAIAFDRNGNFVLGTKGKILKYKANDCYLQKK